MSKISLLSDLHFGTKQDSNWFLKYQLDYLTNEVLPLLEKNQVKNMLLLGDIFHSRKILNVNTLHWVKQRFFDELKNMNINVKVLVGNHDAYLTKTNEITSLSILKEYPNIEIIETPKMFDIDGYKFSMIPWLANDEDIGQLDKFIKQNNHDTMFGHFEFSNFEEMPGHKHINGLNHKRFKNFRAVYSGHFHCKQEIDNVQYIGSPYELTWADFGLDKGVYLINSDSKELEFYKNEKVIYKKIYYDEDLMKDFDYKNLEGNILQIFVVNKSNESKYADFIYQIEQCHAESFVLMDAPENETTLAVNDDNKNTLDIVKDYIVDADIDNKEPIIKIMTKLYKDVVYDK